MKSLTPETAIRRVFGESHCPTAPVVKEYGWIKEGEIAYELSEGQENGKEWVGYRRREEVEVRTVTVVFRNTDEWERLHDACETFWGYDHDEDMDEKALEHIESLRRKYN